MEAWNELGECYMMKQVGFLVLVVMVVVMLVVVMLVVMVMVTLAL